MNFSLLPVLQTCKLRVPHGMQGIETRSKCVNWGLCWGLQQLYAQIQLQTKKKSVPQTSEIFYANFPVKIQGPIQELDQFHRTYESPDFSMSSNSTRMFERDCWELQMSPVFIALTGENFLVGLRKVALGFRVPWKFMVTSSNLQVPSWHLCHDPWCCKGFPNAPEAGAYKHHKNGCDPRLSITTEKLCRGTRARHWSSWWLVAHHSFLWLVPLSQLVYLHQEREIWVFL